MISHLVEKNKYTSETNDFGQICVVFPTCSKKKGSACCFVCHQVALAKVGKGRWGTFRLTNRGGDSHIVKRCWRTVWARLNLTNMWRFLEACVGISSLNVSERAISTLKRLLSYHNFN